MTSYAEHSKITPEFEHLLTILPRADSANYTLEDYRRVLDNLATFPNTLYQGPKNCDVTETTIAIRDGTPIPVRVYTPNETARATAENKLPSILFHFHGGGWIGGNVEFGHPHCLWFASHNVIVLNVDYRFCPENSYNTPQNDCYGVYRAVHHAAVNKEKTSLKTWGIPEFDTEKVYLYGTSAGAQIATASAIIDIESNRAGVIKGLFLHGLPAVDAHLFPTEKISSDQGHSIIQNKDAPFVNSADMDRYTAWRNSPPEADKYFSPLVALGDEELKQFPKVYHEAYGMDVLRDGQLLFAERMKGLDVDTRVQIHSGYAHCLFSTAWMLEGSKVALNQLEEASRWIGLF
ncbi:uncharacterized protein DFL_007553 [Arthrobotrys flagrans]|uniref:Alpha/beta hydrolase fold-3 domain-containing protein n=1 Tax=Arthrobotrys flagrans TaxID=97331 RepID=A0A436ZW04_ARTFL|nr:hypothetical protein DFL_007553 [Arthrobotrys flagrans]